MKKIVIVLFALLALASVASAKKHPNTEDFNLTAHVTAVNGEQRFSSHGSVDTDSEGKVSGSSHGSTYNVLIYTVKIEGKPVIYQMEGHNYGFRHAALHLGDYKARWKNGRILEVLYLNDKDEEKVRDLLVDGEQQLK